MERLTTERLTQEQLDRAATLLRSGKTVAFPTETVYGLGANALDAKAVEQIFWAKQRPSWDPLIVHVSDPAMLEKVVAEVPPQAQKLIDAFWPGPLTLLLKKRPEVPDTVTAGRALVGVRMPGHALARNLIQKAGVPIAAPSANRFGHVSPTTAQHVLDDLNTRIHAVLDAGSSEVGVESTVLDPTQTPMVLYRPGAVTAQQIEAIAGPVVLYQPPEDAEPESMPSPGVGIRHYAPMAEVQLIASQQELNQIRPRFDDERIAVLLPEGWKAPKGMMSVSWASMNDTEALANMLFASLRTLEVYEPDRILVPLPKEDSGMLAAALRDRLQKAAMKR